MDGFLVINKPLDWTSFDVVAKIRNRLQVKVGHTGTLDPKATGVLVLCLGKATKKAMEITATDKEYIAEITLGATSTTDDTEGDIERTQESGPAYRTGRLRNQLGIDDIQNVLSLFTGTFDQMPPDFSAIKVKGKRAYKAARAGKPIKLEPRSVIVHKIELLEYKWPVLKLKIRCGKGFYVRALARDIGQKLEVGGYLSTLQRTRVGHFSIDGAITIEEVDESKLIPIY